MSQRLLLKHAHMLCLLLYTAILNLLVNFPAAASNQPNPVVQQLANAYIQFDIKIVTPPGNPTARWWLKVEAGQLEQAVELELKSDLEKQMPPVVGEWRTFRFDLLSVSRMGTGINLEAIDKILIFPTWGMGANARYQIDNIFIGTDNNNSKLVVFDESSNGQWPAWDCCGGTLPEIVRAKDRGRGNVVQFSVNNGNSGTVLGFNTLESPRPKPFNVTSLLDETLLNSVSAGVLVKEDPTATLHFSHLNSEAISTIGTIYKVLTDPQGFMWFGGSDGLARYDGYGLKVYKHDNKDPTSLSNNSIWDMLVDSQGRFWIATDLGINLFSPKTQTFTHYLHDPQDQSSLSHNIVKVIYEDSKGDIWIGTYGGGLNRMTQGGGKFERFQSAPDIPNSLSNNTVNAIFEDRDGTLWIGTEIGLNKFNSDTNGFTSFYNYWGDQTSLDDSAVRVIAEGTDNRLWIGTYSGLNQFDRNTGTATRFKFQNETSVDVVAIEFDSQGQLWMATGQGLVVFNPEARQYSKYQNNPYLKSSFEGNYPASIYKDDNENWWLGTFPGGINYVDYSKNLFTTYLHEPNQSSSLSHNSVLSIAEAPSGNLWLGTDGGGLNYFNKQSGQFNHYLNDPDSPRSLAANSVLSITLDHKQQLWLGAWHAQLSILDTKTDQFIHQATDVEGHQVPSSWYIWTSLQDRFGDVWLGTTANGLIRFRQEDQSYFTYYPWEDNPDHFVSRFVWSIFEDSAGDLWFGTSDGLAKYLRDSDIFEQYQFDPSNTNSLSNNIILDINEDLDGNLWIGTRGGGVNKFDRQKQTFVSYGTAEGLPDDVVTGILPDDNGYLWLSTFNGLCRFAPDTNSCTNFSNIGGLQSNKFNIGAALKLKTGELVFGSTGGFTLFHPDDIKSSNKIPPVVLTDFQIANRSVPVAAEGSPLTSDISLTREITLDHEQSMFSIEFSALDYQNPGKNNYAYLLQGYDEEWNDIGYRRRATYTNLDPGSYVFRVKGANSKGIWNDEGAAVTINILPPPWKSWWAYSIYLFTTITVLGLIIYLQVKKLQERKQLKLALWASGDELWNVDLVKQQVFRENSLDYLDRPDQGSWLFTGIETSNIHPDDRHSVITAMREQFEYGSESFELTYREKTKSGDWVWLQDRGKVTSRDIAGTPTRFSGTTKNIHPLKTTEAKLVSLNQELEQRVALRTSELQQSNEFLKSTQAQLVESEKMASLGTVVVGVSHELNTPVGIAVTALSNLKHQLSEMFRLAEQGKLTKTAFNKFRENASASVDLAYANMSKSISIITSFRKISVDRSSYTLSTHPLRGLIEFAVAESIADAKHSDDNIEIACPDDLIITTYDNTFSSILKQLLNNARQHAFTPGAPIHLDITAKSEGQNLVITLQDHGKGMDEEEVASIF